MNEDGLAWQSKGGKRETVAAADVRAAAWVPLGRQFQLKLTLKGGTLIKFDGFRIQDRDFLTDFLKSSFRVELEEVAVSVKGWNWGELQVVNNVLQFDVNNERAFELPLAEVANIGTTKGMRSNKHELALELHQSDANGDADTLVELKLYVPPKTGSVGKTAIGNDEDGGDAQSADADDDADADAGKPKEKSRAQLLTEAILARANIVGAHGGAVSPIVKFSDIPVVTPRNKYDLCFYATFFEMVAPARSFKVMYSHVTRLITLSKPDGKTIVFIVSLDPPILQGHTTYPHIVMHVASDETVDLAVDLRDEPLRTKYGEALGASVSGPLLQALAQVFAAFTTKKTLTSVKDFKSGTVSHVVETDEVDADGNVTTKRKEVQSSAIRCSYKANVGLLYALANSFFFIYKPPMYIRHDEIDNVEFAASSEQRYVDLIFNMKNGSSLLFGAIQRPDFKPIFEFMRSKSIKVKDSNTAEANSKKAYVRDDDDGDDDDDDGPMGDADGFAMDGSESEDEDFEDKGAGEEVSEEYATPDESLDGDAGDDGAAAEAPPTEEKKKKKKDKKDKKDKKEKKEKKDKKKRQKDGDDDAGGSDDDEKRSKKPRKEKDVKADDDDDDDDGVAAEEDEE